MSDFSVPTRDVSVEIVLLGGRVLRGHVFVGSASATHAGPMHLDEWIGLEDAFFPFVAEEGRSALLLNKGQVLALSCATAEAHRAVAQSHHRVMVEAGGRRMEGIVDIEMPQDRSRLLDMLNGPARFFLLRDGDRSHLVQKGEVSRVTDLGPI